ncbi:MAG: hypothetical protein AAF664_09335 [Planctomycetota bacterium]
MNEHPPSWKTSKLFRPLLFLFLLFGPFVILPSLMLSLTVVSLRAAWSKQPRVAWRISVASTIVFAFFATHPTSPFSWRSDWPIAPQYPTSIGTLWLVEMQRPYLNAAIIGLLVAMPLSATSAIDTAIRRRRNQNG